MEANKVRYDNYDSFSHLDTYNSYRRANLQDEQQ